MKLATSDFFNSEKFNLCVIFLFASAIMLPILFYGVPNGYDMPHHYQCALTYHDAILSGDLYPSWTNLRNLGYGGLELRLYPPLSHYLLALFSIVINDWHLATWLTYSFWWILGSVGVYLWVREFTTSRAAMLAALLYAVMPYRLNQVYLVFFYGELAGSAVFPFCFVFLARIVKERKALATANYRDSVKDLITPNVIGFSISYALLILTHLPLTLIVSFTFIVYSLANINFEFKSSVNYLLKLSCAGFLALASTSFFWIKVFQERSLMAKTLIYEDIYLNYQLNFLLTPLQDYNLKTIVVYDVFTLVYDIILLITILTVLPLAITAIFRESNLKNSLFKSVWLTFLLSIFLTTPFSKIIWDNFSLMQEVQFPWRWLSIVSLFAPAVAAYGFDTLQLQLNQRNRPLALILIGIIFIGASFSISNAVRGATYTSPNEINQYVAEINKEAGFKFWWTIWARSDFIQNSSDKVIAGEREFSINIWNDTEREILINAGKSTDVRIATFYHPNWSVLINNDPAEIRPGDYGEMIISIPPEFAVIQLNFDETFLVKFGRWISLILWSLFCLYNLFFLKNRLPNYWKYVCRKNTKS